MCVYVCVLQLLWRSESSCRSLDMWPSTQEEEWRNESEIPPETNQKKQLELLHRQQQQQQHRQQQQSTVMPCCGLRGLCQYETNKLVRIQSVRLGSMKWSLNAFILLFIWWVNMWDPSAPASLGAVGERPLPSYYYSPSKVPLTLLKAFSLPAAVFSSRSITEPDTKPVLNLNVELWATCHVCCIV